MMSHDQSARPSTAALRNRPGLQALESLARLARQAGLYGQGHPITAAALREACGQWAEEADPQSTEIRAEEDRILWNGEPLPLESGPVARLQQAMRERLISSIRFGVGVQEDDLARLVELLNAEPEAILSSGGATQVFNRAGAGIQVEDVDLAGRVRESVAAWQQACSQLGPAAAEGLGMIAQQCVRTVEFLGENWRTDEVLASLAGERDAERQAEEAHSAEEKVATDVAHLIQSAGELACAADESYWTAWRAAVAAQLAELGAEWTARIFRAASGASPSRPDVFALIARDFSPEECVSLVLEYPGAIHAERSSGLSRLLSRIMPDPERQRAVGPLLRQEAIARGVSEDVYRNVIELLMPRPGQVGARKGDLGDEAEAARGAAWIGDIDDLLETIAPEAVRRSHVATLMELLGADLDGEQHRRVVALLMDKIEQYAEDEDRGSLIESLRCLQQAAEQDTEGQSDHRALIASALAHRSSDAVAAGVLAEIAATPDRDGSRLVSLLGGLGDWGMDALESLVLQPAGPHVIPALDIIIQRSSDGASRLRQIAARAPRENLPQIIGRVLTTGSPRLVQHLGAIVNHADPLAKLDAIRLVQEGGGAVGWHALVELLNDPAPATKVAVVEALREMQATEATAALCALGRQQEAAGGGERLQEAVVEALAAIGSEEVVPWLRDVLFQRAALPFFRVRRVRLIAAEALGRIGGPAAREALERGRSSRRRAIRDTCARMLSRFAVGVGTAEESSHVG